LKFDSGWLGGYSKESLRNGHLHTRRMQPGLPRIVYALVMAETQRSPESVSIRKTRARLLDPPGLRRLRFPFFDSLVKERSGRSGHNARVGFRRPVHRGNEAIHPVDPGEPRAQSRDCLPTAAHQYMAREAP
jgi:hypothetical protein